MSLSDLKKRLGIYYNSCIRTCQQKGGKMNSIENLFLLMKERNITAKQLSDGTGISQGNISDWKSGKTKENRDSSCDSFSYGAIGNKLFNPPT